MFKHLFRVSKFPSSNNPITKFLFKRQFPLYEEGVTEYYFTTGKDKIDALHSTNILTVKVTSNKLFKANGYYNEFDTMYYCNKKCILTLGITGDYANLFAEPISKDRKNQILQAIEDQRIIENDAKERAKVQAELDKIQRLIDRETLIKTKTKQFQDIVKLTFENFQNIFPFTDKGIFLASNAGTLAYLNIQYGPNDYRRYSFTYYSNNVLETYINEAMAVALIGDYVNTCTKALNGECSAEASLLNKISEMLDSHKA